MLKFVPSFVNNIRHTSRRAIKFWPVSEPRKIHTDVLGLGDEGDAYMITN